jgi:hypothetical protein
MRCVGNGSRRPEARRPRGFASDPRDRRPAARPSELHAGTREKPPARGAAAWGTSSTCGPMISVSRRPWPPAGPGSRRRGSAVAARLTGPRGSRQVHCKCPGKWTCPTPPAARPSRAAQPRAARVSASQAGLRMVRFGAVQLTDQASDRALPGRRPARRRTGDGSISDHGTPRHFVAYSCCDHQGSRAPGFQPVSTRPPPARPAPRRGT